MFERTQLLLGEEGVERLRKKTVTVIGLGGVGGFAAEALARCGVNLILIDKDIVEESNRNRQILALKSTLGREKAQLAMERVKDINDSVSVKAYTLRFEQSTAEQILSMPTDYICDCIDSVSDKVLLVAEAKKRNIPIVSALGTANRIFAQTYHVIDIFETKYDPLARAVRKALREKNIKEHEVVTATEECVSLNGKLGSMVFCPAICGLTMASHIIKRLLEKE